VFVLALDASTYTGSVALIANGEVQAEAVAADNVAHNIGLTLGLRLGR
jgi:hypothetical protein